jgi:hypothetical protein
MTGQSGSTRVAVSIHRDTLCQRLGSHRISPIHPIRTDLNTVPQHGPVQPPILPGQVAQCPDLIRTSQCNVELVRMLWRGGLPFGVPEWIGSTVDRILGPPRSSPVNSSLYTHTTLICDRGISTRAGTATGVAKTLISAVLIQGLPLTSDFATKQTYCPACPAKSTCFLLAFLAKLPLTTGLPHLTLSALT